VQKDREERAPLPHFVTNNKVLMQGGGILSDSSPAMLFLPCTNDARRDKGLEIEHNTRAAPTLECGPWLSRKQGVCEGSATANGLRMPAKRWTGKVRQFLQHGVVLVLGLAQYVSSLEDTTDLTEPATETFLAFTNISRSRE
jgi:hypothetical protein